MSNSQEFNNDKFWNKLSPHSKDIESPFDCILNTEKDLLPSATKNHRIANSTETYDLFISDFESIANNKNCYNTTIPKDSLMAVLIETLIKWGVLDARNRKD